MLKIPTWRDRFPGLSGVSDRVANLLDTRAHFLTMDKGKVIFGPGNPAENLLLLVEGTIRVQQLSEDGREIVLYRVNAGESCVLTTACLLAFENYSAEGIAETDIKAILIPRDTFDEMMSTSKDFRAFVFQTYSKRITDLFLVIEEMTFRRMDIRVAQKLLELQSAGAVLRMTHQKLAAELGTAREVILRQLKEFERRGWLRLGHSTVELRDIAAIGRMADLTCT